MAKRSAAVVPEVIDVVPEEQALALTEGQSIVGWLKTLQAFFSKAQELESAALVIAKTALDLTEPKNGAEDETLQKFVVSARMKIATVEEHWTITSMVHRFHRRLTAKRAIAVDALNGSILRGTQLHERYKAAEARRVQQEEERLRKAAEEQAQRERQAELERLEAEALEKEAASADLTDRERRFLGELAQGQAAAVAAKYAGYRNWAAAAAKLLQLAKIQKAMKAATEAKLIREQAVQVAAKPLEVEPIEEVASDVRGSDRETWTGEIVDAAAFVEAFRSGQYGIPGDLLTVDQKMMNKYATDLRERLNRWPGVRAKKKTTIL